MVNVTMQYRRAVKKKLRCGNTEKDRILEGFDQVLAAYTEEHNTPAIDDLTAAFGSPEEMAEVLMAQVSPQEQAQYHKNSLFKKIVAIILAVVLMLFTVYVLFIKEYSLTYDTTITIDPTVTTTEEVLK